MIVFVVPTKEKPYFEEIDGSLESLQKIVGGYVRIAPSHLRQKGIVVLVDEDGMYKNVERNVHLGIYGTALLVGEQGEDFASLTNEQQKIVEDLFEMAQGNE